MLNWAVALLLLQASVQKAQVAAPPPPPVASVGKARAAPSTPEPPPAPTCVDAPAPGHAGARGLDWVINSAPAEFRGRRYVKYGLPRVLGRGEVAPAGAHAGGYLYAEAGSEGPAVLYLLTDLAGCEFQPYQREE